MTQPPQKIEPETCSLEGTSLIEANAGTGKTYTLSQLALRFIAEKDTPVDRLLIVTYTKAATAELRKRIRELLLSCREEVIHKKKENKILEKLLSEATDEERKKILQRITNALRQFDDISVQTIHSFCYQALQENAFESGMLFDTEMTGDISDIKERIAHDFWRQKITPLTPALLLKRITESIKSPPELEKAVASCPHNPAMVIHPEAKEELSEIQKKLEQFPHQIRKQAQKIHTTLQKEGQKLSELIAGGDVFYKKYTSELFKEMVEDIDTIRSCENEEDASFFLQKPQWLKLFLSETKKVRAKQEIPPFRLFKEMDMLHEIFDNLQKNTQSGINEIKRLFLEYRKKELSKRMSEQSVLSFDKLITLLASSLQKEGSSAPLKRALAQRYSVALIDEFQDTDTLQFFIFSEIFQKQGIPLFLIGDPKQAIYAFRGADIHSYLKASETRGIKRYILHKNYRSETKLVQAINHLFEKHPNPFLMKEITYTPSESTPEGNKEPLTLPEGFTPLQFWYIDTEDGKGITKTDATTQICRAVTAEITSLLHLGKAGKAQIGKRNLLPSDIAVLVRNHTQAKKIKREFEKAGIVAVLSNTGDVFASDEAKELLSLLSAGENPKRLSLIYRALSTVFLGRDAEDILKGREDEKTLATWQERFYQFHETWHSRGIMAAGRELMEREEIAKRLLHYQDGERRITNLLHLLELLHAQEMKAAMGASSLLQWFSERVYNPQPNTPEEHELRLERDDDAVQIVTIHSSKGLQYPVCFLPFLWDTRNAAKETSFTYYSGNGEQVFTLYPDDTAEALHKQEVLAEELRLIYVALTRAKNRCYVVTGEIRNCHNSALSYLLNHQDGTGLSESLCALTEHAGGNVTGVSPLDEVIAQQPPPLIHQENSGASVEKERKLRERKFTGSIDQSWRISSFSQLVSQGKQEPETELPDRDEESITLISAEEEKEKTEKKPVIPELLSFPAGAGAGNFFHELLEHYTFTTPAEKQQERIEYYLKKYHFDTSWKETISKSLETLFSIRFKEGFSLSQIQEEDKITELEFSFPLQEKIYPQRIQALLQQGLQTDKKETSLSDDIPAGKTLQFSPVKGIIKGFIDLVFRSGRKYYIIDWKSNHLGKHHEDYQKASLQKAVAEHRYDFQYLIYTSALHRYLTLNLPGYSYDEHFGGVYYLFLRGLAFHDSNRNSKEEQAGIFFARPAVTDMINRPQ